MTWAQARQAYMLAFEAPERVWAAHRYAVQLTIPVGSKTATFFYHCGLFPGMSGRIDVIHPPGTTGLNTPVPFDAMTYYERLRSPAKGLDLECGTRGLADTPQTGMMGPMGGAGMRGMMPRRGGGGAMQWGMMSGGACAAGTKAAQFAVCMAAIEHAMMMPSMMDMMHGGCDEPLAMFVKQARQCMMTMHAGAASSAMNAPPGGC